MNRRNFLCASLGGIVALTAGILAPTALSATNLDYTYDYTFRVSIGCEIGRIVDVRLFPEASS